MMTNKENVLHTKQILGDRLEDLSGKRFDKLLVIKFDHRTIKNRIYWECLCDCGTVKLIDGFALRYHKTTSCGCYNRERSKESAKTIFLKYTEKRRSRSRLDIFIKPIIKDYKVKSKKRNLAFDLSEEEFRNLITSNCFYCGCSPKNEKKMPEYAGSLFYNGIDRVDNTRGYSLDNCVPCCIICNKAKRDLTKQEFLDWIKLVYNKQFGGTDE